MAKKSFKPAEQGRKEKKEWDKKKRQMEKGAKKFAEKMEKLKKRTLGLRNSTESTDKKLKF
jgi:hypothetical protein